MKRIEKIRSLSDKDLAKWLSMQNRTDIPDIVFQCWHYCTRDYGCAMGCPFHNGEDFRKQWLEEECGDLAHMAKLNEVNIPWVDKSKKFARFGGRNEK